MKNIIPYMATVLFLYTTCRLKVRVDQWDKVCSHKKSIFANLLGVSLLKGNCILEYVNNNEDTASYLINLFKHVFSSHWSV